MPISTPDAQYLREYLVYKAIEAYSSTMSKPITAIEGRTIRRNMRLRKKAPQEILNDLAEVIPRILPGRDGEPVDTNALIKETEDEYFNPPADNTIPISPYDPRWAWKTRMLEAGTNLRYVNKDEITDVAEANNVSYDDQLARIHQFTPRGAYINLYSYNAEREQLNPGQRAVVGRDTTGINRLRQHMSPREYGRIVAQWGNKPAGTPDIHLSRDELEKADAIFSQLDHHGINYRCKPGYEIGQINVTTDSGHTIRVLDHFNQSYIGRTHHAGAATYLIPDHGTKAQRAQYSPSPADLRTLIDSFVAPTHGRRAGTLNPAEILYTANGKSRSQPVGPNSQSVIKTEVNQRRSQSVFFADTEEGREKARNYIEEAVYSAIDHYTEQVSRDAILTAAAGGEIEPSPDSFINDERQRIIDGINEGTIEHTVDGVDEAIASRASLIIGEGTDENTSINPAAVVALANNDEAQHLHNSLVAAYQRLGISPQSIMDAVADRIDSGEPSGEHYDPRRFADDVIVFDDSQKTTDLAEAWKQIQNNPHATDELTPDVVSAATAVGQALDRAGIPDWSARMDHQGIVEWEGTKPSRSKNTQQVRGTIGQFPTVETYGDAQVVRTRFAATDDYELIPEMSARISYNGISDTRSLGERTIAQTYQASLDQAVDDVISRDLVTPRRDVGTTTNMNAYLRRLGGERRATGYWQRRLTGTDGVTCDRDTVEAIMKTEAKRLRYPSDLADGRTGCTELAWRRYQNSNQRADTFHSNPSRIGTNLAITAGTANDGYFDQAMTPDGDQQGLVRYLPAGAAINPENGHINRSTERRADIFNLDYLSNIDHDPADRQMMTGSNLMRNQGVDTSARVVMSTCGGWNMDDGMVVSQQFANRNGITSSTTGDYRPLVVGDKISDMHGNKGVISAVVDPDMDDDEAETRGLTKARDILRATQDQTGSPADVIMSPYSSISRFNAGTTHDLLANPETITTPNGSTASVGTTAIMVTQMTVEKKTTIYTPGTQGRAVSSQLLWALQAKDCTAMTEHFMGSNAANNQAFIDIAHTAGLHVNEEGTLEPLTDEHVDIDSKIIDPCEQDVPTLDNGSLARADYATQNAEMATSDADYIKLPMPVTLASGQQTPQLDDDTWLLPLRSAHQRCATTSYDGTRTPSTHARELMKIIDLARRLDSPEPFMSKKERETRPNNVGSALDQRKQTQRTAVLHRAARTMSKSAADELTGDGNVNVAKDNLMKNRQAHSATAVWTPNPQLDIDTVALSPAIAENCKVKDGDTVVIFRDPILTTRGVRAMTVTIDDNIEAAAVNPTIAPGFDGDFDGDTIGILGGLPDHVQKEAKDKLSVQANLLDRSHREDGLYPLAINTGLDVATGITDTDSDKLATICQQLNDNTADPAQACQDISQIIRNATIHGKDHALRFDSLSAHMDSIDQCWKTGAKGSEGKRDSYAGYAGISPSADGDWKLDETPDTATDQWQQRWAGSQECVALKKQYTALAGANSQRAVLRLRQKNDPYTLESALELSYLATQSMLQAKHDPVDAKNRAQLLEGTLQAAWDGHAITRDDDGNLHATQKNCTPKQWVSTMHSIVNDDMGLSIDTDHLERVANGLSATDDNGERRVMSLKEARVTDEIQPTILDEMAYGRDWETIMTRVNSGDATLTTPATQSIMALPQPTDTPEAAQPSPDPEPTTPTTVEPQPVKQSPSPQPISFTPSTSSSTSDDYEMEL